MSVQGDDLALGALKYAFLCKVMLNQLEDVNSLLTIKLEVQYAQLWDVESMHAIARAHRNRADFEDAEGLQGRAVRHAAGPEPAADRRAVLGGGDRVRRAGRRQGRQAIEAKLSQMILDKVFRDMLDQGRGRLLVFDSTYEAVISTLEQVNKVVWSLHTKVNYGFAVPFLH